MPDHPFLAPEVRRRLADNGLRVGLFNGPLPAQLMDKLAATGDPIAALTADELSPGTEMLSRREKRQCRLGISEVLEVLPQSSTRKVVLFSDEGSVRAEQFEQPRGFFTVTPYAHGNGQLKVELVPGIDHGAAKQRVIGNQGSFPLRCPARPALIRFAGICSHHRTGTDDADHHDRPLLN